MTKVVFRKFADGQVIAIFPEIIWREPFWFTSYMHAGQHGGCTRSVIYDTAPATPDEYASLLRELKEIGYNDLKVFQKITLPKWIKPTF